LNKEDKLRVGNKVAELMDLLSSEEMLDESKSIGDDKNLTGIVAAISASLAINEELSEVAALQVMFNIAWSLGRLEYEGNKKVFSLTKEFPSAQEVLDIINTELKDAAFRLKGGSLTE